MDRRVAFLSEHASPVALLGSVDAGGQNVYVDEVSRNLVDRGYAVDVFTRREAPDALSVIEWAPGVRIVNVAAGPPRWIPKDDLWPLMPVFLQEIQAFIRAQTVPYDLLHGNFWMSGWVATRLRERLGLPAVQIFHAMGKTKQRHQGSDDSSPSERIAVELEVVERVDRLIAQCPSEEHELTDEYGADPGKVEVIPSAVNIERFSPIDQQFARKQLDLPPDELIVGYVGRMLPRKDVRNVVRAVARISAQSDLPVSLLLVGGETPDPDPAATPEIGELQRLAEDLGIGERVRFVGKRQPDLLRLYYSAADVAVTTPWYEPFGLTPLEGMACGRPVIGSAVGGITYTIQDGITGFLVPPRDPEALAARLTQLVRNEALRHAMGQAARARVEREFTWSTVAHRTAALYDNVLRAQASAPRSDTARDDAALAVHHTAGKGRT